MADLPVDRTTANTPAEHVADHNVLHATHNLIDGDGSNGQVLTRVGGVPTWAAPSGSFVADAARVDTSQTTTSTTYVDLATAGPAVTVTTGTRALVMLSGFCQGSIVNAQAWISVAVSGATTIAAADSNAMHYQAYTGGGGGQIGTTILITGLTPGSNTFTAKYRTVATATGTFAYRTIAVVAL